MRNFLPALALVCAALGPEAWTIIPGFRAAVHRMGWIGAHASVEILGLVIAVILLDLFFKGRLR